MEEQKVMWVDPHTLNQNKVTNELYTSVPENFDSIKENIKQVGILEPLIVDTDNVVISGNMRLRIALELGIELVPVIYERKCQINAKLLAVSHSQQRIKKYSELLKEYEILEAEYSVGKGCRTDLIPEMKKKKEKMKNLPISYAKINKLKNIRKYGEELYGKDSIEYKELWESVDEKEVSLDKKQKSLRKKIEIKENFGKIPDFFEIKDNNVQIYNKPCKNMSELEDGSIACIVTSPPYFHMRDYDTGDDQRGLEKDMDSYIKGLIHDMSDCKRVLKEDGSLWVNLNEGVMRGQYNVVSHRFVLAMMNDGWIFNDEIIWIKNNANFTQARRSVRAHEYIFHFVKNSNYYYDVSWLENVTDSDNRISFGTGGKIKNIISSMDFRGNILRTNGNNMESLRKACKDEGFNLTHSAGFPLSVPLIAILTTSKENDTILDIYSGTGTSSEAAILANRKAVGYEIKPEYIMGSKVRLKPYLLEESDENSKLVA